MWRGVALVSAGSTLAEISPHPGQPFGHGPHGLLVSNRSTGAICPSGRREAPQGGGDDGAEGSVARMQAKDHIGGTTPLVPTTTVLAEMVPSAATWEGMNTTAPGTRSALVAGANVTIGVTSGMSMVFSLPW
ncbi:hypothetical protein ABIB57_002176 [Devosia sp. UYZn731]